MTNTDLAPHTTAMRDALVKSLKDFSLTYEQHQMLHGPGIGLLASRLCSKGKYFTIVLGCLSVICVIQAGRGLFSSGQYNISWIFYASMCGLSYYRRRKKTDRLRSAYRDYVAADCDAQDTEPTLADDLRLGFNLDYDEFQAIHAGDAELAASRILDRCRANTRNAIKGAVGVSAFGLLGIVAATYSDTSIYWGVGVWFSLTCIVAFAAFAVALVERATARRCEKLICKYNHQDPHSS